MGMSHSIRPRAAAVAAILLSLACRSASADAFVVNSGNSWTPADVLVEAGETVHWNWVGFHNVAEVDGPTDTVWNGSGFHSGPAPGSGGFSQLFDAPDLHHFVCEPHAGLGMRGTVTVVEAGTLHEVVDAGSLWLPADLTIHAGDTVRWRWTGFHNVVETDGPDDLVWNGSGFFSGFATPGGEFVRSFDEPGTVYYVCDIHSLQGMRGSIVVLPTCPDPTPLSPELAIAYDPAAQTVHLSWSAVDESVGGCPLSPLYRVLAGPAPDALSEIALTGDTSLVVAAGASAFFEVVAVAD